MPRILSDDLNELRIRDNISGSDIVFYYRMPTTAERAAYSNESFRRQGRKVKVGIGETRQKYGLKILAGFREGDFELADHYKMSSDPASEFYNADWKEHIAKHAGDLVELLAIRVFDMPASVAAPDEDEDEDEGDGEGEDAEKN